MKRVATTLTMLLLMGCATSGAGPAAAVRALPVSMVDTAPELVGCPYQPADRIPPPELRVSLSFVVAADGTVEPGTVRHVRDHHSDPSQDLVDRAMRIALSCTFAPAVKDGQPVAARIGERFDFIG